MKFSKRNSTIVGFAAVSLAAMAMLATTTMVAQGQVQSPPGVLQGPPTLVGNPTGLSTGPPVPNCNAVDQGNFHGPPNDLMRGCK